MTTGNGDDRDSSPDRYEGSRVDWRNVDVKDRKRMESLVHFGSSLRGSNLSSLMAHTHYSIVCGLELQNWSRYELTEPICVVKYGYLSSPPVTIKPGEKEAMITHKTGYSFSGSCGIVSWLVKRNCRRLFVLWSAPYFASNRLAVGMTSGITTHDSSWFDNIWNERNVRDLLYTIRSYDEVCGEIKVEDESFQVLGTMGNSSKPEIKIIFRPKNSKDLSIRL